MISQAPFGGRLVEASIFYGGVHMDTIYRIQLSLNQSWDRLVRLSRIRRALYLLGLGRRRTPMTEKEVEALLGYQPKKVS